MIACVFVRALVRHALVCLCARLCARLVQTQRLVAEFTEHSSVLQSFSFNADKTLLITASADNTAKVCARQQCGTLPTVSDCPPPPLIRRASTLRVGCFCPQYKLDTVGRGRMGRLGSGVYHLLLHLRAKQLCASCPPCSVMRLPPA